MASPQPRSGGSSRSSRASGSPSSRSGGRSRNSAGLVGRAGRTGGRASGSVNRATRRTDANERRKPARPRGENSYKHRDEKPQGRRGKSSSTRNRDERSFKRDDSDWRKRDQEELPRKKGWGSLARKGAASVKQEGIGRSSEVEAERRERPRPEPSGWDYVRSDDVSKRSAKKKKQTVNVEPIRLAPEAIREIEERVGAKKTERYVRYLRDAARAYAAERWGDVRKALRPLLADVPDAPSVQELHGMLLYRTGKWAQAIKELEASHLQTLSYDLYPAIMDAHRALKQWKRVDERWAELREASPVPEVMAEGRIVYASSLADRDRLQDSIRLLEKVPRPRRQPKEYHLRSWYVLGDLYERMGDVGQARVWFERVAHHDPELADVLDRLELLD